MALKKAEVGLVIDPLNDAFYGKDDATAAREYRCDLARRFVSGLRITYTEEVVQDRQVVAINVREYPAYLSPMNMRKGGGGYVAFDPDDPVMVAEIRRQGLVGLKAWFSRYGDTIPEAGPVAAVTEALEGAAAA